MRSFTAPKMLSRLEGTVVWEAFVEGTPPELHGQIVRRWLKHYYGRDRVRAGLVWEEVICAFDMDEEEFEELRDRDRRRAFLRQGIPSAGISLIDSLDLQRPRR